MSDFFKPWRRKAGVLALVMACIYEAIAVVSIVLPMRFYLSEEDHRKDEGVIGGGFLVVIYRENWNDDNQDGPDYERQFFGFLWGQSTSSFDMRTQKLLFIPCWPIVLPLTATSTFLLRKPRSAKKPSEFN